MYIMSDQPSSVIDWKIVGSALRIESKLLAPWFGFFGV